jgi:hypothetical protein
MACAARADGCGSACVCREVDVVWGAFFCQCPASGICYNILNSGHQHQFPKFTVRTGSNLFLSHKEDNLPGSSTTEHDGICIYVGPPPHG